LLSTPTGVGVDCDVSGEDRAEAVEQIRTTTSSGAGTNSGRQTAHARELGLDGGESMIVNNATCLQARPPVGDREPSQRLVSRVEVGAAAR
jgi:hypothetical protein